MTGCDLDQIEAGTDDCTYGSYLMPHRDVLLFDGNTKPYGLPELSVRVRVWFATGEEQSWSDQDRTEIEELLAETAAGLKALGIKLWWTDDDIRVTDDPGLYSTDIALDLTGEPFPARPNVLTIIFARLVDGRESNQGTTRWPRPDLVGTAEYAWCVVVKYPSINNDHYRDTLLHEIGHYLGLPHVWDFYVTYTSGTPAMYYYDGRYITDVIFEPWDDDTKYTLNFTYDYTGKRGLRFHSSILAMSQNSDLSFDLVDHQWTQNQVRRARYTLFSRRHHWADVDATMYNLEQGKSVPLAPRRFPDLIASHHAAWMG